MALTARTDDENRHASSSHPCHFWPPGAREVGGPIPLLRRPELASSDCLSCATSTAAIAPWSATGVPGHAAKPENQCSRA